MAYTSEIEKLEKRWAENPKGRNFAPLADAYRKAGEVDRAVELCTAGLALHPDYVSAHIVYGRCLMDQKNDPGASDVFQKVLTLDPENVLALKILAEIAERGNRHDEAVTWLTRLLAADPMNGEAAEALTRTKSKATQSAGGGPGPTPVAAPQAPAFTATANLPSPPPRPPLARTAPMRRVDLGPAAHPAPATTAPMARLVPETQAPRAPTPRAAVGAPPRSTPPRTAAPAPPPPPLTPPPPAPPPPSPPAHELELEREPEPPSAASARAGVSGGIETFDGTLTFDSVAHEAAKAEGLEVQEEVQLKPQDLVVEGLAPTQWESAVPSSPPPASEHGAGTDAGTAAAEPLAADTDLGPSVDLPLIMPDELDVDLGALAAPQAPPTPTPPPPPLPWSPGASVPGPPRSPSPPPPPPPAAVALSDDDGAADTATLSRSEPVVTETMAQLYLRQGHTEEALRVYQALLAQRPGDARLRARVAGLSGQGAGDSGIATGESVTAFLRRIIAGRPAPEGAAPAAPAPEPPAESVGSPLDGAFAIAPLEPEPRPGVSAPGEATRPAADSISLDAVFGDVARSSIPVAEPAAPAPPPPAPAAAADSSPGTTTGGFSFDQFFSSPASGAEGGQPAGGATRDAGPARTSGSKPRAPAEDEADLDQFQAWLRGLKS